MLTKIFIFIYARPRRGRTPVVRVGCQRSDKVYLERRNYAAPWIGGFCLNVTVVYIDSRMTLSTRRQKLVLFCSLPRSPSLSRCTRPALPLQSCCDHHYHHYNCHHHFLSPHFHQHPQQQHHHYHLYFTLPHFKELGDVEGKGDHGNWHCVHQQPLCTTHRLQEEQV